MVLPISMLGIEVVDISKTDRVYADLRRRIRELALRPGAPLRKEEIAAALGTSRAPVSDAIARLAEEGLVDVFPQYGSFVASVRATDVRESLWIRTGIETEAARRVAPIADEFLMRRLDLSLAEQDEALKQNDLARFYDVDEAFHALILTFVGTTRALRMLDSARAPLDRLRRMSLPEKGRARATLEEHRRIVEGIRSGDSELAAAAMRAHLSQVGRAIEPKLVELEVNNESESDYKLQV